MQVRPTSTFVLHPCDPSHSLQRSLCLQAVYAGSPETIYALSYCVHVVGANYHDAPGNLRTALTGLVCALCVHVHPGFGELPCCLLCMLVQICMTPHTHTHTHTALTNLNLWGVHSVCAGVQDFYLGQGGAALSFCKHVVAMNWITGRPSQCNHSANQFNRSVCVCVCVQVHSGPGDHAHQQRARTQAPLCAFQARRTKVSV